MKEDSKQLDCHSLMVYDWVLRDNNPYQIDSLGDLEYLNAYDYILYPIPITPEILEKNGFKKIGDNEHIDKLITILKYVDSNEWNISISNDGVELDYDFKFVNELQHALRLCKIDKEIEL